MRFLFVLTSFVGLSLVSTPAFADLIGSTVTVNLYFPTFGTPFSCCGDSGTGTAVVGAGGVDFTTVAFDGTIEVTGTQISWTATVPEVYSTGAFNGFDLKFSGAPTITNVTLDAATTLTPVGFGFSGNDVHFNLEGLSAAAGQKTILDVETGVAAVPEPGSLVLLGSTLMILASYKSRFFSRA